MKREFLSTNEVAEILGISPFTIRRYIQLRKLKALKLEGSYRVRRSDLKLFLKAREIETEEELAEIEAEDDKSDSARRAVATKTTRPSPKPAVTSKRTPVHLKTRARHNKRPPKNTTHKQKEP